MNSNIFADIDNTNNPFKIAQFIFENLEPNDIVYFSQRENLDGWYYKYKITDIIYDTDTKDNKRRSFILSKKIEADNKPDSGFCGYKSVKDYLAHNKVPFYRFQIVHALTNGKAVSVYSNYGKVCSFTINVDQYFEDFGYIRFYKNFSGYSKYDAIEDTTNSLRYIVNYLKDSREGYLNELLDLQSMIDYYYFLTSNYSNYNNLRETYLCDLVKPHSGEFCFVWDINTKKYTGNTEINDVTDDEKSTDEQTPGKKLSNEKTPNEKTPNEKTPNEKTPDETATVDNYKAATEKEISKDSKEDSKEDSKGKKYSAPKSSEPPVFYVGEIVIDYNDNYGYISQVISKNVKLSSGRLGTVYRYKWQPLGFGLVSCYNRQAFSVSNEIDLRTPVSLYYKRIGRRTFITDENAEAIKKRREALQKAALLWKDFRKKLDENINKRTESFLKNNDAKSIEYAEKVLEQIKNKNVKLSADDNNSFDNSDFSYHNFDNSNFPYLRNYLSSKKPDISKPDISKPDIPLPKKLDFDSSEYGHCEYGHYNEKKEKSLCDTVNDIIDYLLLII